MYVIIHSFIHVTPETDTKVSIGTRVWSRKLGLFVTGLMLLARNCACSKR